MSQFRLVQFSDPHLSRSHPMFHHNWEVALTAVAELAPDAIFVTGDLSYNGPDAVDDLDFSQAQMARLSAPLVRFLPGNHDVGYSPAVVGAEQVMTPARRQNWLDRFGPDFWVEDIGGWRLIGLNPFLIDSGQAAEAEQDAALTQALDTAPGPVGIFTHVPPFLGSPQEGYINGFNMLPEARHKWLTNIGGKARFIASGHLHKSRSFEQAGMAFHWCPAISFMQSNGDPFAEDAVPWVGFLVHDFNGGQHVVTVASPQDMINMDIRTWDNGPDHSYMRIAKRPFPMP